MFQTAVDGAPRILIVEDNRELAELYAHWLEDACEVEVAHDATAAYSMFHEPFDVALLDRDLPDRSGDELLAEIREFGLDWRVAMVTVREPSVDVLELDFDEYLCKPLSSRQLASTVSQLVTCVEFRSTVTDYSKLTAKQALVETYCSANELENSEEYAALQDRLHELEAELLEMTRSFPELPDFEEVNRLLSD